MNRVLRLAWLAALSVAACGGPPPRLDGPAVVLYDPVTDVCLVSNVGGAALAKDGDGSIVRVSADGRIEAWIRGGHGGVTLHAPTGMALAADLLWVADIDVLRAFDRRSGAPRGEVPIPGATSLAHIAAGAEGALWCTDAGVDAAGAATGTDAIWRLADPSLPPREPPTAVLRGTDLGQPRGIVVRGASAYVVNARDGQFFAVDWKGRRTDLARAPQGGLDGLVRVETDGRAAWYATDRRDGCVHRFDAAGTCVTLPVRLDAPAGCGYDVRRGQLVVPLFTQHRLERLAP